MKKKSLLFLIIVLMLTLLSFGMFACDSEDNGNGGESNGADIGNHGGNNVEILVDSITLNRTRVTLGIGDTVSLYETVYPSDATDKRVTWSSSNVAIATVSNGLVTAKAEGTATVTAKTSNNKTATCAVTVNAPTDTTPSRVEVTSISLNASSQTLQMDTVWDLKATVYPSDATDKSVTWSTSNATVATVSNGRIMTKEEGTATITAKTGNNKTATCVITVIPFAFFEQASGGYSVKYKGNDTVAIIPETYQGKPVTSISSFAFENCTSLESVEIPNSVTSIGVVAFSNCTSLKNIKIPDGVTSIGASVFKNCTSLKSIEIPNSVTTIGFNSFEGCNALEKVNYLGSIDKWAEISFDTNYSNPVYYAKSLYIDNNIVTDITLTSAKAISNYAFIHCESLADIDIVSNVNSVGKYAFAWCSSLKDVKIPNGTVSIGNDAFYGCSSLTSVEIPSSVTSIESDAFEDCNNVTIFCGAEEKPSGWDYSWSPESYKKYWAYGGDRGVTSSGLSWYATNKDEVAIIGYVGNADLLTIPTSIEGYPVTSILTLAFSGCDSLISVEIANTVTSIEYYAFSGCDSLTRVTIPISVTSIAKEAFHSCKALTIYCEAESAPSGWVYRWQEDSPVVWDYKNQETPKGEQGGFSSITFDTPACPLELNRWAYSKNNLGQWVKDKTATATITKITCSFEEYTSVAKYLVIKVYGNKTWDWASFASSFAVDYKITDENGYVVKSGSMFSEECSTGEGFIITKKIVIEESALADYGTTWTLTLTEYETVLDEI